MEKLGTIFFPSLARHSAQFTLVPWSSDFVYAPFVHSTSSPAAHTELCAADCDRDEVACNIFVFDSASGDCQLGNLLVEGNPGATNTDAERVVMIRTGQDTETSLCYLFLSQ